jgi:response regulator RpfG family c-di-GMP phosphodiesterase
MDFMESAHQGSTVAKPRILCVDDQLYIVEMQRDILRRSFEVHTATSGAEGLLRLKVDPDAFSVVISDMRMPEMTGSVFLREARSIAPDATRILLTGYADLESAIQAVNDGGLFRFLTKPCPPEELVDACMSGVEQHRLLAAERVLLEQTLKGSVKALTDVLSLASPAAFGRGTRVHKLILQLAKAIELTDLWEVEVAALLTQIGAVTLPTDVAEKVYSGEQLSVNEQAMVDRVPVATRAILENIPRLEGVLEILGSYQHAFSSALESGTLSIHARMLRIAIDYDALEAQGGSAPRALGIMRGRSGTYDSVLLERFADAVDHGGVHERVIELGVMQLRAGMTLAGDVRGSGGALLIARGHDVTQGLVEHLINLGRGQVREPLLVLDDASNSYGDEHDRAHV